MSYPEIIAAVFIALLVAAVVIGCVYGWQVLLIVAACFCLVSGICIFCFVVYADPYPYEDETF